LNLPNHARLTNGFGIIEKGLMNIGAIGKGKN